MKKRMALLSVVVHFMIGIIFLLPTMFATEMSRFLRPISETLACTWNSLVPITFMAAIAFISFAIMLTLQVFFKVPVRKTLIKIFCEDSSKR